MDDFGQIGREKPDYPQDLDRLAEALERGAVRVKLGERMTSYELVLCIADRLQRLEGDVTPQADLADTLFVALWRQGCGFFHLGWVHPSYVAEVLTLEHAGDGDILSAFVQDISEAVGRRRLRVS